MKKRINKAMREKITPIQYFFTQIKILKELFQYNKVQTLSIILISCLTSVGTSIIELKFLEHITNNITNYLSNKSSKSINELLLLFIVFLLLLIIMHIMGTIYDNISQKYQSNVSSISEKKIIFKLSQISYEHYESEEFYEKINLARQASGQYTNAVYGITQIFNIVVMLISYTVILSKLNVIYLSVVVLSIILSVILSARVTDKQLDFWRIYVSPVSRKTSYFSKIFSNRINHQNIQIDRNVNYFLEEYQKNNNSRRKNYMSLNMISFFSELLSTLLFMVTFIFTALYVGKGVVSNIYDIGYFTMSIAMLLKLFACLKQFSMFLNKNNWYIKVLQAYYEIIDIPECELYDSISESNMCGIILNDLIYCYPQSEKNSLNGISATFKLNEKIAIVGNNGSGKTTLISILLSLLESYKGSYIGKELPKIALLQDFCQYQMTIKENIEIGCGGRILSDDTICKILEEVDLLETVKSFPKGIYTMLGQLEDGIELSKGQWQRLAIARMLANKEAVVWILDEPTAYLDPISEIEIYKLIWSLSSDKLVFFISHRLGFAKNADRIIVVENGKIIENGTHHELIQKKGVYSEMYNSQKEWYC